MKTKIFIAIMITVTGLGVFYILHRSDRKVQDQDSLLITGENEIPELLAHTVKSGPDEENAMLGKNWEILSSTLKKDPANVKARLKLAELFMTEARITGEHPYYYPAAMKMINILLKQNPGDRNIRFSALSLKASVQLSLHQFSEGLKTARQAVTLNPYNSSVYGALVDANVELGNYDEAVMMADKMVSIRPDLRSYSRISYLREIYGDVKGAIEAMDMAVKAGYPGYETTAWARFTLGKIYENYGDRPKAEMQYHLALIDRPDYAFALEGLATIEMYKGNTQKAEDLLKKAAGIIPEISFHTQLAKLYLKTGRKSQAEEEARNAIRMMAEDEKSGHIVDLEKAKIYLELLNDPDKALFLALKEYKVRPKNIDVNLLIGKALVKKAKYTEAAKYLKAASATRSKNPELLQYIGIVEANSGKKG